jgi:hypothetical protein
MGAVASQVVWGLVAVLVGVMAAFVPRSIRERLASWTAGPPANWLMRSAWFWWAWGGFVAVFGMFMIVQGLLIQRE